MAKDMIQEAISKQHGSGPLIPATDKQSNCDTLQVSSSLDLDHQPKCPGGSSVFSRLGDKQHQPKDIISTVFSRLGDKQHQPKGPVSTVFSRLGDKKHQPNDPVSTVFSRLGKKQSDSDQDQVESSV